jgi:hypothetical protein
MAKNCTVTIEVTGLTTFRWRMKVAQLLMRLVAWIIPFPTKIVRKEQEGSDI